MIRVSTRSPEETRALGKTLGSLLDNPMTFCLTGDLGSGKTVFVQGLAAGLSIPWETEVTSPSFALIHEHVGRLPLFHVDLYRLEGVTDLEDLGLEEILDGQAVVAVEWGEKLSAHLLGDHLRVRFEIAADMKRVVEMSPYGQGAAELLEKVNRRS